METDWQGLAARLRSLSLEMLQLAKAGDWESVTEREERRRDLIKDLFEHAPPPSLSPFLGACLREVIDCNSELMTLAGDLRNKVGAQLQWLARGRRASAAYGDLEA
jgi:hypothetical protein